MGCIDLLREFLLGTVENESHDWFTQHFEASHDSTVQW